MLEINTIRDFAALSYEQQIEVQRAIKSKERLEEWLRTQNKKQTQKEAHWVKCKVCDQTYPGWVLKKPRNNADIHPSQIYKCLKVHWYCCIGESHKSEERIDPKLQMIFDMGHAFHHVLQSYGERGAWGDSYKAEVPIDPDAKLPDGTPVNQLASDLWIRGSVDAILDRYYVKDVPGLGDISIRVVHEYKTMNSANYMKLTRPKPEHKQQAMIYSAVFDIPIVVFLYVNKDNCQMAEFTVPFDHTVWNEVKAKIEKVQHFAELGVAPPWEETSAVQNPRDCMECGFFRVCGPPAPMRR